MESKFEGALAIADSPKKENPMNKIVIENFGDWRSFRNVIEDAWKNIDYDPRENEFSRRRFINGILGSYAGKISADDFKKLSYLITKEIKELNRHKEKAGIKSEEEGGDTKEKYVQRDMRFGDGEED